MKKEDYFKIKNNSLFYDGFEGEGSWEFKIESEPDINITIWDGYIDDIFGEPIINHDTWKGFTRDSQECIGPFEKATIIDSNEYLEDMKQYLKHQFRFRESIEALNLMLLLLNYAIETNQNVIVEYW